MNVPKLIFSLLAIALGTFLFVYGGADDSPGAQLIGLLVAIGGVAGAIKSKKKKTNENHYLMTTQKRNAIIYWIATIWLGFAMVASGLQQVMHGQAFTEIFTHLGYPLYFMPMVGLYKLVSVVILLSPRQPLLKEWSYFGTALIWIGAIISHVAVGDVFAAVLPPAILLVMTLLSWHFRPAGKKFASSQA